MYLPWPGFWRISLNLGSVLSSRGTLTHTTAKGTKVSPIKIEKEVKAGPKSPLKQHSLAVAQKTTLSLTETLWTRPAHTYHATFKLIFLKLFKPIPNIF